MLQAEIIIKNPLGLHAQPATSFVRKAMSFSSEVKLSRNEREVDGKSTLSVLTLAAGEENKLTLTVSGEDERDAFNVLKSFLEEILG